MENIRTTYNGKYEVYSNYKGYNYLGLYENLFDAKEVRDEYFNKILQHNLIENNLEKSDIKKIKGSKNYATKNGFIINKYGVKLKGGLDRDGYPMMIIFINKIRTTRTIHRLIMETFIPHRDEGLQVNHINGVKTDNRLSNLEWVTASENIKHAYRLGLMK